jgi:hypothetical protein
MEAHINHIAHTASGFLLNPYAITMLAVFVLALVTGFAARVTFAVQDLRTSRTRHRGSP